MTAELAPRSESEEDWSKAQQRVSLYLRLMNLPPLESLELAQRTLKLAFEASGQSTPLSRSMQALRRVLGEGKPIGKAALETDDPMEILRIPLPAPLGRGYCGKMRSSPLINRGLMLPEDVG